MPLYLDADDKFHQLRNKAEALIRARPDPKAGALPDMLELIHELRIHQAELAIQNEELQRAQQELSELHQEYENLYEFAPCGYMTLDAKGIISRINLTGTKLLGATRQHLLRASLSSYIDSNFHNDYLSARQKAGATGRRRSVELWLNSGKTTPLWVRAEIEADRDTDGGVKQWRVVLVDNTDAKSAEAALRASEERFRKLFEHAPVAYQSLDASGKFVAVNAAWLSLLGYRLEDVIGRPFSAFLNPDWKARYEQHFIPEKTCAVILGSEIGLRKKDGTDILVSFHGNIGRDEMGAFNQTHCVFHDITALREAENAKQKLEDQLRQAKQLETIGTLAGGVAHEFNNILSIIIGHSELAADSIPDGNPARENMKEILTASMRARDVVRQLLTFSRQDEVKTKPMRIGPVVTDAVKLIRSSTPANIDIKLSVAGKLSPLFGNATQLNQLLINLCKNAADAMLHTGGRITIAAGNQILDENEASKYPPLMPGSHVKLIVRDTGCGMDKETLDKLFEPFFTTKQVGKGTGIGLAVVHGIVQKHNGSITVESEVDKGTAFTVFLPAHQGIVREEVEKSIALPRGDEKRRGTDSAS